MKKLFLMILALSLVLSAACPALADGAWVKYDPPIEFHVGSNYNENGAEMSALNKETGETLSDNRWTKYFLEECGIQVVYDLVDPVDYDQSLLLGMASGDLPDYFRISNYGNMRSMAEAGMLTPMREYYDKYASPLLKSIIESEGELVFQPGTFDGVLYGIPCKMPSTNSWNHLFIRQDWLDKLGLERPTTMDDVTEIARAFVEKDPDGNGVDDTIGLAMDNNFLWQSAGIFWAFGAYPNGTQWIERDGKIVYATVQPEIMDGIKWLKNMYDEGLIDREFGALNYNKGFEEPIMNGKCGMMYAKHWNAFVCGQLMAEDPDAKWVSLPLPEGTTSIKIPSDVAMDYMMCVNSEAEHPEALIYLLNAYADKLFGENADFDHYFADGDCAGIWSMSPFFLLDPLVDLDGYRDIQEAYDNGTLDQLTGGPGAGFYNFYKQGSYYYWLMFGAGDSCFRFVNQTYNDEDILWNNYKGAPTPTMVERWSSMEELLVTSFTKMIQGQEELENFDTIVEQWYLMGGEKVTEEVNEIVNTPAK